MDCHMPELDGFQTTLQIRKLPSDVSKVPVIALTASISLADKDECAKYGMDGFLSKPMKMDDLQALLRTIRARGGSPAKAN